MKERILVVEDSPTQAAALQYLLAREGYRVEVATSGEAGLELAGTAEFDLVLSDILMPGLNGYELCRRIKAEPDLFGTPRVVLLTTLSDPVYVIRGLESGADNYLIKQHEPGRLLTRIRQILGNQVARRVEDTAAVLVRFLGEEFTIGARREQILCFFLSSFEELLETNRALQESKESLQKTLQREQSARRAAEAAAMARDVVLATVSHDLRNPLNAILMNAGIMRDLREVALDPRVRDRIVAIAMIADQMRIMIDDLLDTAMINAGGLSIECSAQDALALAREEAEIYCPIAAEGGLTITADLPTELPAVYADGARIRRVISNLIGNALKFTPAGGEVTVGARVEGEEVLYWVRDTGPGIPREDLQRIFQRFWRGNPNVRGGAGLGLSIAKWVIDAHGGRIWVESEVGRGACFYFTLPLAKDAIRV